MVPPAKLPTRHPDRREQIIAVASELFLAHGLDGVSVDAVVDRAGGSKSSVYSYFGNKEGLFIAVVERLCAEILVPLAAIDVTGLPSITVGSIGLNDDFINSYRQKGAATADIGRLLDMLARGDFDLVAVGRALIANPDWPAKIRNGHFDQLAAYEPKALETLV